MTTKNPRLSYTLVQDRLAGCIDHTLLKPEEKKRACHLVVESGAQFVKTSTGLSSRGATIDDVKLLREIVGPKFGVKAAGGIHDALSAIALLEAGATRLGTSSGVAIIRGAAIPAAGNH